MPFRVLQYSRYFVNSKIFSMILWVVIAVTLVAIVYTIWKTSRKGNQLERAHGNVGSSRKAAEAVLSPEATQLQNRLCLTNKKLPITLAVEKVSEIIIFSIKKMMS
jgi:hypothetical protein